MERRLMLTYDISDDKTRTRVHKFLRNFGLNTQKSVFEMIVDDLEYRRILFFLMNTVQLEQDDSIRIYDLCKSCTRNITKLGDGIDLHRLDYQII